MINATLGERRKEITKKLQNSGINGFANLINSKGHQQRENKITQYDRDADLWSFIGLQLSLLSDPDLSRQHQQLEEELFSLRVDALDDMGILQLMAFNKISYQKVRKYYLLFIYHIAVKYICHGLE